MSLASQIKSYARNTLAGILSAAAIAGCSDHIDALEGDPEILSYYTNGDESGFNLEGCLEAIHDHNSFDPYERRINVVIVGANYTPEQLEQAVEEFIDPNGEYTGLLAVEPFSSNRNRFNFWLVEKIAQIDEYQEGWNQWGNESLEATDDLFDACPTKNAIRVVMPNYSFRQNGPSTYRGTDFSQLNVEAASELEVDVTMAECMREECSVGMSEICEALEMVTGDHPQEHDKDLCGLVIAEPRTIGSALIPSHNFSFYPTAGRQDTRYIEAHEIAHALAALRDGYLEPALVQNREATLNSLTGSPINCYVAPREGMTEEQALRSCERNSQASEMIADGISGCTIGCSYLESIDGRYLLRFTDLRSGSSTDTIMYNSSNSTFAPYEELIICDAITAFTGDAEGVCDDLEKYRNR